MINIFIALLFLLMSYGLFNFSFAIHGINRLIINAPRTIFEYSVVTSEDGIPFYSDDVKERYLSYIDENIYDYVDEYTIDFRFYNPSTGGRCYEECEGVDVKITSRIAFSYSYTRTMFYEIREVNHG